MGSFKIENTEFGIGSISFSIDHNTINLEINGNENVFDKMIEKGDSKWDWALYPPKIYFRNIPYEGKNIIIDEEFLNKYDIALYMMEYNDFTGTLEIDDKMIHIIGQVDIMGEIFPIAINVERNDL